MTVPSHPLKQASFFWFWLGQGVSLLGDKVYTVALPFLLFELGGDAGQLGQLFAAFIAPQVVFLVVGGVLVDRVSRKLAMLSTDVVQALLSGAAVFLLIQDSLNITHLYLLSALFGLAGAVSLPATMSIVPQLVDKEQLTAANSARAFVSELAGVLGPPLGGVVVAAGGLTLALGFDAVTFVVAALCMSQVRVRRGSGEDGHEREAEPKSYLADIKKGFAYVSNSTWLWATILVFSLGNVFMSGTTVILLPIISEVRFGGAAAYGVVLGGVAVGALVMSLAMSRVTLRRRGVVAYAGFAVSGLGLVALGFAPTLSLAVVAAFVMGASIMVFSVVWESTLQALVPGEVLGRVASLDMLGSMALMPVGFLVTGYLAEAYAAGTLALWYGLGSMLLAGIGLTLRSVRTLD